jgi:hypothetical protein
MAWRAGVGRSMPISSSAPFPARTPLSSWIAAPGRPIAVSALPVEGIMRLAAVDEDELGLSYERNHIV